MQLLLIKLILQTNCFTCWPACNTYFGRNCRRPAAIPSAAANDIQTYRFSELLHTKLRKAVRPYWPQENLQERQDLRRRASRKDRNYEGNIEVNGYDFRRLEKMY